MIIKHPVSTEKAVKLMESENKLIFIVDKKATKDEIKKALQDLYKIKISKINTLIHGGEKKAYVKLAKENSAMDIATQLVMM